MASLKGPIYEIHLQPPVAHCCVWVRADVDAETGAKCASEMRDAIAQHVFAASGFEGIVFDVRDGPPAFGPKTQGALTEMIGSCREAGRRIAFLVGSSAVQQLQFTRLKNQSGTPLCEVFLDESQARAFIVD